jgi:recombination endonuclease VII
MDTPGRECDICSNVFLPRRRADRTCSLDCQIQLRRRLSRETSARHYKVRPLRPDADCESCKARIPAPRTGPMPRWCVACRAAKEDVRARARQAVRRCYKCQEPLPEAVRKPGKAVCTKCRVDPRDRGREHEQRRRLRKYGLTQDEYDQLLRDQGGRCPGCRTTDPGVKGWCIDHCHKSGRVRGLLCGRCNTMLGLANEDPAILRSLADLAERLQKIDREIKI